MNTVAKALLIDKHHNILVLRRSDTHPLYPLHNDMPGGEVEPNENPQNAVARELVEETGLQIPPNSYDFVEEKVQYGSRHMLYKSHLESIKPVVQLSWEHEAYEWISVQALLALPLPQQVDPFYVFAVETIRKYAHGH